MQNQFSSLLGNLDFSFDSFGGLDSNSNTNITSQQQDYTLPDKKSDKSDKADKKSKKSDEKDDKKDKKSSKDTTTDKKKDKKDSSSGTNVKEGKKEKKSDKSEKLEPQGLTPQSSTDVLSLFSNPSGFGDASNPLVNNIEEVVSTNKKEAKKGKKDKTLKSPQSISNAPTDEPSMEQWTLDYPLNPFNHQYNLTRRLGSIEMQQNIYFYPLSSSTSSQVDVQEASSSLNSTQTKDIVTPEDNTALPESTTTLTTTTTKASVYMTTSEINLHLQRIMKKDETTSMRSINTISALLKDDTIAIYDFLAFLPSLTHLLIRLLTPFPTHTNQFSTLSSANGVGGVNSISQKLRQGLLEGIFGPLVDICQRDIELNKVFFYQSAYEWFPILYSLQFDQNKNIAMVAKNVLMKIPNGIGRMIENFGDEVTSFANLAILKQSGVFTTTSTTSSISLYNNFPLKQTYNIVPTQQQLLLSTFRFLESALLAESTTLLSILTKNSSTTENGQNVTIAGTHIQTVIEESFCMLYLSVMNAMYNDVEAIRTQLIDNNGVFEIDGIVYGKDEQVTDDENVTQMIEQLDSLRLQLYDHTPLSPSIHTKALQLSQSLLNILLPLLPTNRPREIGNNKGNEKNKKFNVNNNNNVQNNFQLSQYSNIRRTVYTLLITMLSSLPELPSHLINGAINNIKLLTRHFKQYPRWTSNITFNTAETTETTTQSLIPHYLSSITINNQQGNPEHCGLSYIVDVLFPMVLSEPTPANHPTAVKFIITLLKLPQVIEMMMYNQNEVELNELNKAKGGEEGDNVGEKMTKKDKSFPQTDEFSLDIQPTTKKRNKKTSQQQQSDFDFGNNSSLGTFTGNEGFGDFGGDFGSFDLTKPTKKGKKSDKQSKNVVDASLTPSKKAIVPMGYTPSWFLSDFCLFFLKNGQTSPILLTSLLPLILSIPEPFVVQYQLSQGSHNVDLYTTILDSMWSSTSLPLISPLVPSIGANDAYNYTLTPGNLAELLNNTSDEGDNSLITPLFDAVSNGKAISIAYPSNGTMDTPNKSSINQDLAFLNSYFFDALGQHYQNLSPVHSTTKKLIEKTTYLTIFAYIESICYLINNITKSSQSNVVSDDDDKTDTFNGKAFRQTTISHLFLSRLIPAFYTITLLAHIAGTYSYGSSTNNSSNDKNEKRSKKSSQSNNFGQFSSEMSSLLSEIHPMLFATIQTISSTLLFPAKIQNDNNQNELLSIITPQQIYYYLGLVISRLILLPVPLFNSTITNPQQSLNNTPIDLTSIYLTPSTYYPSVPALPLAPLVPSTLVMGQFSPPNDKKSTKTQTNGPIFAIPFGNTFNLSTAYLILTVLTMLYDNQSKQNEQKYQRMFNKSVDNNNNNNENNATLFLQTNETFTQFHTTSLTNLFNIVLSTLLSHFFHNTLLSSTLPLLNTLITLYKSTLFAQNPQTIKQLTLSFTAHQLLDDYQGEVINDQGNTIISSQKPNLSLVVEDIISLLVTMTSQQNEANEQFLIVQNDQKALLSSHNLPLISSFSLQSSSSSSDPIEDDLIQLVTPGYVNYINIGVKNYQPLPSDLSLSCYQSLYAAPINAAMNVASYGGNQVPSSSSNSNFINIATPLGSLQALRECGNKAFQSYGVQKNSLSPSTLHNLDSNFNSIYNYIKTAYFGLLDEVGSSTAKSNTNELSQVQQTNTSRFGYQFQSSQDISQQVVFGLIKLVSELVVIEQEQQLEEEIEETLQEKQIDNQLHQRVIADLLNYLNSYKPVLQLGENDYDGDNYDDVIAGLNKMLPNSQSLLDLLFKKSPKLNKNLLSNHTDKTSSTSKSSKLKRLIAPALFNNILAEFVFTPYADQLGQNGMITNNQLSSFLSTQNSQILTDFNQSTNNWLVLASSITKALFNSGQLDGSGVSNNNVNKKKVVSLHQQLPPGPLPSSSWRYPHVVQTTPFAHTMLRITNGQNGGDDGAEEIVNSSLYTQLDDLTFVLLDELANITPQMNPSVLPFAHSLLRIEQFGQSDSSIKNNATVDQVLLSIVDGSLHYDPKYQLIIQVLSNLFTPRFVGKSGQAGNTDQVAMLLSTNCVTNILTLLHDALTTFFTLITSFFDQKKFKDELLQFYNVELKNELGEEEHDDVSWPKVVEQMNQTNQFLLHLGMEVSGFDYPTMLSAFTNPVEYSVNGSVLKQSIFSSSNTETPNLNNVYQIPSNQSILPLSITSSLGSYHVTPNLSDQNREKYHNHDDEVSIFSKKFKIFTLFNKMFTTKTGISSTLIPILLSITQPLLFTNFNNVLGSDICNDDNNNQQLINSISLLAQTFTSINYTNLCSLPPLVTTDLHFITANNSLDMIKMAQNNTYDAEQPNNEVTLLQMGQITSKNADFYRFLAFEHISTHITHQSSPIESILMNSQRQLLSFGYKNIVVESSKDSDNLVDSAITMGQSFYNALFATPKTSNTNWSQYPTKISNHTLVALPHRIAAIVKLIASYYPSTLASASTSSLATQVEPFWNYIISFFPNREVIHFIIDKLAGDNNDVGVQIDGNDSLYKMAQHLNKKQLLVQLFPVFVTMVQIIRHLSLATVINIDSILSQRNYQEQCKKVNFSYETNPIFLLFDMLILQHHFATTLPEVFDSSLAMLSSQAVTLTSNVNDNGLGTQKDDGVKKLQSTSTTTLPSHLDPTILDESFQLYHSIIASSSDGLTSYYGQSPILRSNFGPNGSTFEQNPFFGPILTLFDLSSLFLSTFEKTTQFYFHFTFESSSSTTTKSHHQGPYHYITQSFIDYFIGMDSYHSSANKCDPMMTKFSPLFDLFATLSPINLFVKHSIGTFVSEHNGPILPITSWIDFSHDNTKDISSVLASMSQQSSLFDLLQSYTILSMQFQHAFMMMVNRVNEDSNNRNNVAIVSSFLSKTYPLFSTHTTISSTTIDLGLFPIDERITEGFMGVVMKLYTSLQGVTLKFKSSIFAILTSFFGNNNNKNVTSALIALRSFTETLRFSLSECDYDQVDADKMAVLTKMSNDDQVTSSHLIVELVDHYYKNINTSQYNLIISTKPNADNFILFELILNNLVEDQNQQGDVRTTVTTNGLDQKKFTSSAFKTIKSYLFSIISNTNNNTNVIPTVDEFSSFLSFLSNFVTYLPLVLKNVTDDEEKLCYENVISTIFTQLLTILMLVPSTQLLSSGQSLESNSLDFYSFSPYHYLDKHNTPPSLLHPLVQSIITSPQLTSSMTTICNNILNWVQNNPQNDNRLSNITKTTFQSYDFSHINSHCDTIDYPTLPLSSLDYFITAAIGFISELDSTTKDRTSPQQLFILLSSPSQSITSLTLHLVLLYSYYYLHHPEIAVGGIFNTKSDSLSDYTIISTYLDSIRTSFTTQIQQLIDITTHFDDDEVDGDSTLPLSTQSKSHKNHVSPFLLHGTHNQYTLRSYLGKLQDQLGSVFGLIDGIGELTLRFPVPLLRLFIPQYSLSSRIENTTAVLGSDELIGPMGEMQIVQKQCLFGVNVLDEISRQKNDMMISSSQTNTSTTDLCLILPSNPHDDEQMTPLTPLMASHASLLSTILSISPVKFIQNALPPIYSLYYLHQTNFSNDNHVDDMNDRNDETTITIQPEHTQQILQQVQYLSLYIILSLLHSLDEIEGQYQLNKPSMTLSQLYEINKINNDKPKSKASTSSKVVVVKNGIITEKTSSFTSILRDAKLFFDHLPSIFDHYLPLFYSDLYHSHTLSTFLDFAQCSFSMLSGSGIPQAVVTYAKSLSVSNTSSVTATGSAANNNNHTELIKMGRLRLEQIGVVLSQKGSFSFSNHSQALPISSYDLVAMSQGPKMNDDNDLSNKNKNQNKNLKTGNNANSHLSTTSVYGGAKAVSKETSYQKIQPWDVANQVFFNYGMKTMMYPSLHSSINNPLFTSSSSSLQTTSSNSSLSTSSLLPKNDTHDTKLSLPNSDKIPLVKKQCAYELFIAGIVNGTIDFTSPSQSDEVISNPIEQLIEVFAQYWQDVVELDLQSINPIAIAMTTEPATTTSTASTQPSLHQQPVRISPKTRAVVAKPVMGNNSNNNSNHVTLATTIIAGLDDIDNSSSLNPSASISTTSSPSPSLSSSLSTYPALISLCSQLNNSFMICYTKNTINSNKSHLLVEDFLNINVTPYSQPTIVGGYISSDYPVYNKRLLSHRPTRGDLFNMIKMSHKKRASPSQSDCDTLSPKNNNNYFFATQFQRQYTPQVAHYLLTLLSLKHPSTAQRMSLLSASATTTLSILSRDLALYPQFNPLSLTSRLDSPPLIHFTLVNLFKLSISPIITFLSLSNISSSIKTSITGMTSTSSSNSEFGDYLDPFGDDDEGESEFGNSKYWTLKTKKFLNQQFHLDPTHFSPQNHIMLTMTPQSIASMSDLVPFPLGANNQGGAHDNNNIDGDDDETTQQQQPHINHYINNFNQLLHSDYLTALLLPKSTLRNSSSLSLKKSNLAPITLIQSSHLDHVNLDFLKQPQIIAQLIQFSQWLALQLPKEVNLTYYLVNQDALSGDGELSMAQLMAMGSGQGNNTSLNDDKNEEKNEIKEAKFKKILQGATTSTTLVINFPQSFPIQNAFYSTDQQLTRLHPSTSVAIKHLLASTQHDHQHHQTVDSPKSLLKTPSILQSPTSLSQSPSLLFPSSASLVSDDNNSISGTNNNTITTTTTTSSINSSSLTTNIESISDTAMLWYRLVDDAFHQSVATCSICFSGVDHKKAQLPTVQCDVCDNCYHPSCLFTWFQESGKSTCPLCRSNF